MYSHGWSKVELLEHTSLSDLQSAGFLVFQSRIEQSRDCLPKFVVKICLYTPKIIVPKHGEVI